MNPLHALSLLAAIAFVPLDDRPVTVQLPVLLGRIAGVAVSTPPKSLLGNYLQPGDADGIVDWLTLRSNDPRANAFVVSTDMLAYGGLVASRVPGPSYIDAVQRLAVLRAVRRRRPDAWIAAFGTIMRLAPTGVPAGTNYFAAYPEWKALQAYANLHDPLLPSEVATAASLRASVSPATFDAYVATRRRDLDVDRALIAMRATGTLDRLVLGQDDAGPVGLHVGEVGALQREAAVAGVNPLPAIEPGADELGMALLSGAIARNARWEPRIAVRYSRPDGGAYVDPLEFAPVSDAIDGLIALCGGKLASENPDIVLSIRVPQTSVAQDDAFVGAMQGDESAGRSVALADLSYLQSYASQASFAQRVLSNGLATRLDAYASWNTNANTVGTALAEAVAAGAGRRTGTYDALAHKTFTFMRFVDDYAYHDDVRPQLNDWLDRQGIDDHTLLTAQQTERVADRNRALLWNEAAAILDRLYPGYHIAAIDITLPWRRTFETEIDAGIAPGLPGAPH
ncbi:MAG TPA: DUF4127 family protein [Candidatus Acidoferrum sp.]|nr:DUF4127 family protein [Candidatus Acidoferrum sp.]